MKSQMQNVKHVVSNSYHKLYKKQFKHLLLIL